MFSGRLDVRLMGCQDLLESVPGRCRVSNMSSTPGSPSESKSLRMRTGLSTRSTNGKTTKTDELSCKSHRESNVKYNGFHNSLWTDRRKPVSVFSYHVQINEFKIDQINSLDGL